MVRFGYDGREFAGWARQPGRRTVEGEILRFAARSRMAPDPTSLRLEVASRTDRGVHARGNVLALTSELSGPPLLRALNGVAPDIWFTHAAAVPPTFRVRSATERWYRYFEPDPVGRLSDWRKAARPFRGAVDVRAFSRGLPADVPVRRDLSPVEVRDVGRVRVLDIRGRSFVWGMVRKIVAALRAVEAGTVSMEALEAAVRGERPLALPLAEPDRLVLWEVRHGVRWTARATGPSRGQLRWYAGERGAATARGRMLATAPPTAWRQRARARATDPGV